MSEPSIGDYAVGWICALQEEYEAACRMLDNEFDGPETSEVNDNNAYMFGHVNGHNVVIGCLPDGRYGTSSAASVARDMVRSFPNLRFALMVGVGGGAPTRERDIRLGDVVVSVPQGKLGGVIQYDFGKRLSDSRFQQTSQLNAPPEVLLGIIPEIRRRHNDPKKPDRISEHLRLMEDMPGYQRPADDRLYCASYKHKGGKNCASCEADGLEERLPRETSREVTVHYGIIASANSVMKNATERDQYAKDPELNILCFEMEAGGLMNNFPCLVIRGICDYSDSHKNDEWHKYAALTAAAYARELLHVLKPRKVALLPSWPGKMESLLAGIQEGVSGIARKADDIIRHQHSQEEEKILEWLTLTDYGSQQSDYINRRQPGTGQWLLDSEEYQAWLKTDKQTLFCPGIPGAGKTMMSSIILDNLNAKFGNDTSVGIAYIYCSYQQQQEQKAEDLLSNLLKQLAQKRPVVPLDFKNLYESHRTKGTRPSFDEIVKVIHSTSQLYSRVFIVIDALDEYHASNSEGQKKLLSGMFSLQHQTQLNLLATSRFVEEITSQFEGCTLKEIRAQDDDVLRYVNERIPRLPLQVSEDLPVQDTIRRDIVKAADGMFLLARLHMDSLMSQPTLGDIKRALRNLPRGMKGLDETYEQAMKRIEGQVEGYRKLAKRILAWVTYAERALSIAEIQHALAVSAGTTELDRDFLPGIKILGSVCAGLITVDKQSDIVRLVHYTTQEYFKRRYVFSNAETDITVACVTYLSFDTFETGFCPTDDEFEKRLQLNPLYDYAARNWGHHARAASAKVKQLVIDLLESEAKVSSCSQAMMAYRYYSGYSQRVPEQLIGAHLAAYFGLGEVMGVLLKSKYNLDSEDSDGRTPLSWAAREGHEAVVKLLLETGKADVDSKDEDGQTPLLWAAENGHKAVVKLLLETGKADVDSKDKDGRTPLLSAAQRGHEAVVKLLLETGKADIDSKDAAYSQTPLSWAAENGHKAVVKLLLETGKADVDSKDEDGRTPLSWAAENGHEAMVNLLLETGKADVDSKDEDGRTPLSWAAENGHEAVVKLLLETGKADVDSKDEDGRTPLLWAAREGHEAMIKLLLKTGKADVDSKDKDGRTPLSWAAENGHEAVVKLLQFSTK